MNQYQLKVYYGYEESTYGVSLEFEVADPAIKADGDAIGERLAELLDVAPDDYHFNYDSVLLDLPDSLVAKIKEDAIREYLTGKVQDVPQPEKEDIAREGGPVFEMEDYVTRYTIEYYLSREDDECRLTDYIYADSYEEAMAAFEAKHGKNCVITMCEPIEVPARYKEYDDAAAPSLLERMEAARRAADNEQTRGAENCAGRSVDGFVKDTLGIF